MLALLLTIGFSFILIFWLKAQLNSTQGKALGDYRVC